MKIIDVIKIVCVCFMGFWIYYIGLYYYGNLFIVVNMVYILIRNID